jgi:hypothetical protein
LRCEWTCDYVDSDFPYLIRAADKKIIAIPYATPGSTDFELISYGLPERLNDLKYLFAAAYRESALRIPVDLEEAVKAVGSLIAGGHLGFQHCLR